MPLAPPGLDCDELEGMGIPLPVTVVGDDPHGLDENGDGLAARNESLTHRSYREMIGAGAT